jgi:hypothetical protein
MSRTFLTAAALALFCVSACEKEQVPDPRPTAASVEAPAPAPPATAPGPTAATTAAANGPSPDTIPVAADFEDEAEKTITKANYKAELASLEAEIK